MSDRYTRYRDLLPVDRLKELAVTIIGVGAIGRQAALQLAAMGIGRLQLVDFDTVDIVNLGPQGFREIDVGRMKVEATAEICKQLNHQLEIDARSERYSRDTNVCDVVFVCVDSIHDRKIIWRSLRDKARWLGDARMAAETMQVLVAFDESSCRHYETTFFADSEAYRAPCTAKSTIYCANIAAGILVAQFSRWLRTLPTDPDICLNLLAMEMAVAPTRE